MGKILISFDKDPAVYEPGSVLSGKVRVLLKEDVPVREIVLTFRGRAQTTFEIHQGAGRGGTTFHYKSEEIYFEKKVMLFSEDQCEKSQSFSGGYFRELEGYEYKFHYQLPSNIPTSFEGDHGSIRYACKLTVKKPMRLSLHKDKLFTVIFPYDLNQSPSAKQSVSDDALGGNRFFCCGSDKDVVAIMSLPKMGYVPGEVIPIDAKIENNSPHAFKGSKAKLIQVVKYSGHLVGLEYTHDKSKAENHLETTKVIAEAYKHGPIPGKGGTQIWANEGLLIPPTPPCMGPSISIKISYNIQFKVKPKGPIGMSIYLTVPVQIGTIPIKERMCGEIDGDAQSIVSHMNAEEFSDISKESVGRKASLYHPLAPVPAAFLGVPNSKYAGGANFDVTPILMKRKSSSNVNSNSNTNLMDTVETVETEDGNFDDKDDTFAPAYTYYNTSFSAAS